MTNLVCSSPSWLLFILLSLSLDIQFGSSICLDDQRSLLLQLNSSLVYNLSRSTKLVTWDQIVDCCKWNGVQCNYTTGRVIGLDLSGESITGGIDNSSSLFKLQCLQRLNMANNAFKKAQIPSGFGKLSQLTYRNMSNAGFNGQIPLDISRLEKLETLDLSSDYYYGPSQLRLQNPSFGMLIQNLTNIRELHLNGVLISLNGAQWCKALSSSVPKLQVLSLSNCSLSGAIDPSLKTLHALSVLRLDQNNLASLVPDFISEYKNLTLLKLSGCQLKGKFPPLILNVPTLRALDLSYNELLEGTLPEFQGNNSLQTLILSFTKFSGHLPHSIGKLEQLRRIDLQNSRFSGPILPISSLHQLGYLDLSCNNFSGPMPDFSLAKNLTHLILCHNLLNGTLESTEWASLSNLVDLDLSSNSLNGNIPCPLLKLPSLLSIRLAQNVLDGRLSELSRSSLIQTLDLSGNRLGQAIPNYLFRLQGLKVLDLSSNRFNSSISLNMIQQLKNLSVLVLSYNNLSVNESSTNTDFSSYPQLRSLGLSSCKLHLFPAFLKTQTQIASLDLSANQIQGRIPQWIWKIGNGSLSYLNLSWNDFTEMGKHVPETPSLAYLDLHSNRLQGAIPKLPPKATYLDLSNNSFTYIIPSDIGDFLKVAILFSVSRNKLSGSIPASFCTSIDLQVLDLSYNLLEGKIPECLTQMTSTLAVLNLRGNQVQGTINDDFPKSCILRTLDVNKNYLEGLVPRSLSNCKSLEVLDLGKNNFTDTFPHWLRSSPYLRVLVLRSNNFSGSVHCRFSDTMWPVLQIIDLAFNHFEGELLGKCFYDWKAMMAGGNQLQLDPGLLQYHVLNSNYYADVVSVTFKGAEFELTKILTIFSSIDFSSNNFQGEIPKAIGNLNALMVLNLSHNGFSGSIPASVGNLTMLESLDLSNNHLSGSIPMQLDNLNFLSSLNLSCNELEGKIPEGTQLQSFDPSSYTCNKGLCGPPLSICSKRSADSIVPTTKERKSSHEIEFDWRLILIGTGFGMGAGLVIVPLLFWKKGREWHDKQVHKLASTILLTFGISYLSFGEGRFGPEEGTGHQLLDISSYYEDKNEDESDHGRFCVFCSKLDFQLKNVIHNPQCNCHGSPSIRSSCSK